MFKKTPCTTEGGDRKFGICFFVIVPSQIKFGLKQAKRRVLLISTNYLETLCRARGAQSCEPAQKCSMEYSQLALLTLTALQTPELSVVLPVFALLLKYWADCSPMFCNWDPYQRTGVILVVFCLRSSFFRMHEVRLHCLVPQNVRLKGVRECKLLWVALGGVCHHGGPRTLRKDCCWL